MPHLDRLRRSLTHDWPGITLVIVTLAAIGAYLGLKPAVTAGNSHRVIDFAAVSALMDKGDLSGREARWYQAGPAQASAVETPKQNQSSPQGSKDNNDRAIQR